MIEINVYLKNQFVSNYSLDDKQQTLKLISPNGLKVLIFIPHDIFEWFINITDESGKKMYSNWIDHYGDNNENLTIEMKESVEQFILLVAKNPIRIVEELASGKKVLESLNAGNWLEVTY